MVPQPKPGTFSPTATQSTSSNPNHSPHPSHGASQSARASPNTSSPTATSSVTKIVVAQVYLLLSTIKEDKDRVKWEAQADQLRKLIDDHGMEVFSKYFTRLVVGNAPQIFPGLSNRPVANPANYALLATEMNKIRVDADQAMKIAEAIESATEDIFREFDLSTFMDHFELDSFTKTILASAFKFGSRADLKSKADTILAANFPGFVDTLSRPDMSLTPDFVATIVDRFIQGHPPNFNAAAKSELEFRVTSRYTVAQADPDQPPSEVLAALDLMRVLGEKPPNVLALYIHRTGPEFTKDEDSCLTFLRNRPSSIQLTEEQVSVALTYTVISQTPRHNPSVLVSSLRRLISPSFQWQHVVSYFDQRGARISSTQFLRLYNALLPIAQDNAEQEFDIQKLWGGDWENPETQLSFICAFASLTPDQLDATTIPNLRPTFTLDAYRNSSQPVRERAAVAVKHPLVSVVALSAVFHVALHSVHASQSTEARRLFQKVVVPNLDIFVVSSFGVPKPWPHMAIETLNSLFDNFLYKISPQYDFVLDSLWNKDRQWVKDRLTDTHVVKPTDLPIIFEHAVNHGWLHELVSQRNGFGYDLAALAHAEGHLNLTEWAQGHAERKDDMAKSLLQFLSIKASLELQYQRPPEGQAPVKTSTSLQVRTVSNLLQILEDFLPRAPLHDLIVVQRQCITVYPRLINYGEGFDDIIDENGESGNALPQAANIKMEEHYKKMYGDEIQVRDVVDILQRYKHSRDHLEQDIFACMIHGLFDEYSHYTDYPLEALATTAVLFGGIISHKLISDLALQIGLGMILEAVRDHAKEDPMFKFGLQALKQLFARFPEWPGFCKQLLQIPALHGSEAWKNAEEVVRENDEDVTRSQDAAGPTLLPVLKNDLAGNGTVDETVEQQSPPFLSINVDAPRHGTSFEDPGESIRGKIQFCLNNLTENTLLTTFREFTDVLECRHHQWFASSLVEERAKMQPNYHGVYVELVESFGDKDLWAQVLRETFISVSRMLNSESTIHSTTERGHLKNLGGWLGLITLARDKPIKHRNIAFKQLLLEAHDTKRLVIVIPFVCKVLVQGAKSTIFKPPNPWLMEIVQLLIELYHNAELKLNLKFEIEVLCKDLSLDHKAIQPSQEIVNRIPPADVEEVLAQPGLEGYDRLSLNGIGGMLGGSLSPHPMTASIPDLTGMIQIPPTNDMVITTSRLHELVRSALSRALQDIIQPVVDRSVTIAAISTVQMIRKDFATEPDEERVRTSAVNMVKATAGSLALVTSKEPLRSNFTSYMRTLSAELPQGLPEGTILMCVNSNLDLACNIIEKQAEERAVPEIEEMLRGDLAARRTHRSARPNDPFIDPVLSRWAWTIPAPFKLSPNQAGLNGEQMAIYDGFARQPRLQAPAAPPSHGPSASDATRSLANEVLQDQYSSVPSLPTPAETPSIPHLGSQLQGYTHVPTGIASARAPNLHVELSAMAERCRKFLVELQRAAAEAQEEHFADLPRSHPVLDVVDALVQQLIKSQQHAEEYGNYAADQLCVLLFGSTEHILTLEALVHVLEQCRKISPVFDNRVMACFQQQPGQSFLNIALIIALLPTDLLDWRKIDMAIGKLLQEQKPGSLEFLEHLVEVTLANERPIALYADFIGSLETAWNWIATEPDMPAGQRLKDKLVRSGLPTPSTTRSSLLPVTSQDQQDYVFDEWVHMCYNPNTGSESLVVFVQQMHVRGVINNPDDYFVFVRVATDSCVSRFEALASTTSSERFLPADALAKFIITFSYLHSELADDGDSEAVALVDSTLALIIFVLHAHHVRKGERFCQAVFFRLISMLFHEALDAFAPLSEGIRQRLLLRFADRLLDLVPSSVPGFVYGWLGLIQHRSFLPNLLSLPQQVGWLPYCKLLCQQLEYLAYHLKQFEVNEVAREIYRATLKLLLVLHHDFPSFMASNCRLLAVNIPVHCAQLLNAVLFTFSNGNDKAPELTSATPSDSDDLVILNSTGLRDILDQCLQIGPTEDAVAHIAHLIKQHDGNFTGFGQVPIKANLTVIDALTWYLGSRAAERVANKEASNTSGTPDVSMLSLLLHELPPEPRYYVLCSMINQLRSPDAQTQYFSHIILDMFVGQDTRDPDELDIRQQIARIMFERLVGYWPQPWGLVATFTDLLKNDKFMFFELPFIKASPEMADRFAQILQRI